jgi:site-specific DNA-methyltransferase (adenine-specific)
VSSDTTTTTGPSPSTYPEASPGAGSYTLHDASTDALPPIELAGSLILLGDASRVLARLPAESVRCVVTSPPYWGLRDYGIDGQIGLEETLAQYINGLVGVFREMRRVLRPDGTFWLNIGDGYTSGNRGWRAPDKKNPARAMSVRPDTPEGLKPKDLIGVPWRLALALQDDGWFLRSDVIWHKPNAMPESVKDRPTRCHEYVFLFSKNESYYYNREAVQENAEGGAGKRNRRTVWSINTEACKEAHFATFPPRLVEPCVLAGSEPGDYVLDPFFGSGTVGAVCQQLQRRFVGIELHPEYVKIAQQRLDNLFTRVKVDGHQAA